MPKLIYHGHSVWEVQSASHRILFDPFFAGNELADVGPDHFDKLDAILVTHGHADHIGDVVPIAKKTGALVVSSFEIANHFAALGCETHGMGVGGGHEFPFGFVKMTIAHHGSTGPNGEALGNPMGIILTVDGKKIYNAGDTGLFLDMKLIAELWGPLDVAILPVGDNFTMGIDDAVKATEFVEAGIYFPQHFNTFPVIEVDVGDFVRKVEAQGRRALSLSPGETYEID